MKKRGNNWHVYWREPDGTQRSQSCGKKKGDAKDFMATVEAELRGGTYHTPSDITFADFAEEWVNTYAKPRFKQSTLDTTLIYINSHFIPYFKLESFSDALEHIESMFDRLLKSGDLKSTSGKQLLKYLGAEDLKRAIERGSLEPDEIDGAAKAYYETVPTKRLADITLFDLDQYKALKLSEGLSAAYIHRQLTPFKTMFKCAVRWGFLKQNPIADLDKPKVKNKKIEILDREEIRKLLAKVHPNYYSIIFTAIFTGLRLGELVALRWEDIDFDKNRVYVNQTIYKGVFSEPKSEASIREIVMSPRLKEVLLEHKEKCPKGKYNLVFPTEVGTPRTPRNVSARGLEKAIKKAEIKRVSMHVLRHTFASLLIAQGANPKQVQKMMGHSSITMTFDKYGHLFPDSYDGLGEALDAQVFGPRDDKMLTNDGEKPVDK